MVPCLERSDFCPEMPRPLLPGATSPLTQCTMYLFHYA
jgi:hypothetical protein